jgi:hypothetical protein
VAAGAGTDTVAVVVAGCAGRGGCRGGASCLPCGSCLGGGFDCGSQSPEFPFHHRMVTIEWSKLQWGANGMDWQCHRIM